MKLAVRMPRSALLLAALLLLALAAAALIAGARLGGTGALAAHVHHHVARLLADGDMYHHG